MEYCPFNYFGLNMFKCGDSLWQTVKFPEFAHIYQRPWRWSTSRGSTLWFSRWQQPEWGKKVESTNVSNVIIDISVHLRFGWSTPYLHGSSYCLVLGGSHNTPKCCSGLRSLQGAACLAIRERIFERTLSVKRLWHDAAHTEKNMRAHTHIHVYIYNIYIIYI